jgi:signal transduction histidine kinase
MTDQARVQGDVHGHDEAAERRAAAERVGMAMLHEIRNVLNPILSAAYLLQAHAHDEAKVRELAAKIEGFAKAEQRVAAKMRQLLDGYTASPQPAPDAGANPSPVSSSSTRRNP